MVGHQKSAHRRDGVVGFVLDAVRRHVSKPQPAGRREAWRQGDHAGILGNLHRLGFDQLRESDVRVVARSSEVEKLAEAIHQAEPKNANKPRAQRYKRLGRGAIGGFRLAIRIVTAAQSLGEAVERAGENVHAGKRSENVLQRSAIDAEVFLPWL